MKSLQAVVGRLTATALVAAAFAFGGGMQAQAAAPSCGPQIVLSPSNKARACAELQTKLIQIDATIISTQSRLSQTTNKREAAQLKLSLAALYKARVVVVKLQCRIGCAYANPN